jgi:O-antigen/teichoic acid export membrane protein
MMAAETVAGYNWRGARARAHNCLCLDGDVTTDGLGARIRSGLAWKAGSQLMLQGSRMVVALVLARMLAPHEWGLAAMVLVISAFVVVFTDSALISALIQRRDLRDADCSTVFWLSAAIGLALMLGGFALAGPLASFYGEHEIRALFAALAVGFLVSSLRTTHMALLIRAMEFRKIETRQMVATAIGAVAGIAVALADYGAWAIIVQQLAETTAMTGLLWFATPWRPSRTFSVDSVRRLGAFAGNLFGENLLYQAGRNLSNLLLGRFLGPASVAVFVLASNVILVPFTRIAAPLQQVFFPAFSQLADERERMADIWVRATRLIALVAVPALVGLAVVAADFVQVVLGSKWAEIVPVIQILIVVGLIQSVQTLSVEVLLAVGRANWLFRFTLLWFLATVGAFALGVRWGVVGVAACVAAVTVLVEPFRTYLASRALGISPWRVPRALLGVAQAAALMAVVALALRTTLVEAGVPAGARLVLVTVVGAAVYLAACLWRASEVTNELWGALGRRRRAAAIERLEPPVLER